MLVDLHVHTTRGSTDSSLRPEELVEEAVRLGLGAVCLTEHTGAWTPADLAALAADSGVRLFAAIEVETDAGHVLVFGEKGYDPEMRSLQLLSERAARNGSALVLAHPFRHLFAPGPGQACLLARESGLQPGDAVAAARLPALRRVHAIEAVNGATPERDNAFAAEVATLAGVPVAGGSDAHSVHGLASGVTDVPGDPRTNAELAEALRSAGVRAGSGLHVGDLLFLDTSGPGP